MSRLSVARLALAASAVLVGTLMPPTASGAAEDPVLVGRVQCVRTRVGPEVLFDVPVQYGGSGWGKTGGVVRVSTSNGTLTITDNEGNRYPVALPEAST